MKRLVVKYSNTFGVVAGATTASVLGLGGIVAADAAPPPAPPPQPVIVENEPPNPVPVAGSVDVSNLPASQKVEGTVNVGNLPDVQTVRGRVDVPLWQGTPYVRTQEIPFGGSCKSFEIPDGKVLFVERATAMLQVGPDELTLRRPLRLTALGQSEAEALDIPTSAGPPMFGTASGNQPGYQGSLEIRLPVTSIETCGAVNDTFTISGYLLSAP